MISLSGVSDGPIRRVWLVGTGHLGAVESVLHRADNLSMSLDTRGFSLLWHCKRDTKATDVMDVLHKLKNAEKNDPDCIILHIGGVEFADKVEINFKYDVMDMIDKIKTEFPNTKQVWCQLLPDFLGEDDNPYTLNKRRNFVDDQIAVYMLEKDGSYIRLQHDMRDKKMFVVNGKDIKMTNLGADVFKGVLKGGIISILNRGIHIHPDMTLLPKRCYKYVGDNPDKFRLRGKKKGMVNVKT